MIEHPPLEERRLRVIISDTDSDKAYAVDIPPESETFRRIQVNATYMVGLWRDGVISQRELAAYFRGLQAVGSVRLVKMVMWGVNDAYGERVVGRELFQVRDSPVARTHDDAERPRPEHGEDRADGSPPRSIRSIESHAGRSAGKSGSRNTR